MADHKQAGPPAPNEGEKVAYEDVVRDDEKPLYAVVGEFERAEDLLHATKAVRDSGYTKLDAFTPFPIHGIDDAMREKRSILGRIVLPIGLTGTAFATLLMWYTSAVDYPLVVGGKPFFAFEWALPIMFELTVLFSAFATVFGMLALNGLPRLYHPIFNHPNVNKVTDDRFLLAVERRDPKFDPRVIASLMNSLGARSVEFVEE